MYQANTLAVYTNKFPLKKQNGDHYATRPKEKCVTTTLNNSQASLLLMLYMYATQWVQGLSARHSLTVNDLKEYAKHPTRWDKQDLFQYNQIHFWTDVDNWKKMNKDVSSTVNTSASTPVLSLPSPPSILTYEQELDCWNKGKRDYMNYLILKDDTEFTDWKDRFTTYEKTEHMARMFNKDVKFRDLVDKHNIDLWNSQEHVKLALHHALQTGVSKSIYQQFKSSPKGIWNNLAGRSLLEH